MRAHGVSHRPIPNGFDGISLWGLGAVGEEKPSRLLPSL